jgi:hypothetical protein
MDNIDEVILRLKKIKENGFIQTHRAHDTGVGKTLEDLLGIQENNFTVPDMGKIELKSKRIETGSMLTLATKAPKPRGINRVLYDHFKYKDEDGDYCLHTTPGGSKPNNLGFQVLFVEDKLILDNEKNINVYWPITIFDEVLMNKSDYVLLVFSETKGERKTIKEYFHYVEAYLLSDLNKNKFKNAIENDKLKVDIRIGVYKSGKSQGKYHDHGTGFRLNKNNFLELYDNYKKIL